MSSKENGSICVSGKAVKIFEHDGRTYLEISDAAGADDAEWLPASTPSCSNRYRCSCCQSYADVPEVLGKPLYRYCPWCGTRMKTEEEDAVNRR